MLQIARQQKPENCLHVEWRTSNIKRDWVFPRMKGGWGRLVYEDKLVKEESLADGTKIYTFRATFLGLAEQQHAALQSLSECLETKPLFSWSISMKSSL